MLLFFPFSAASVGIDSPYFPNVESIVQICFSIEIDDCRQAIYMLWYELSCFLFCRSLGDGMSLLEKRGRSAFPLFYWFSMCILKDGEKSWKSEKVNEFLERRVHSFLATQHASRARNNILFVVLVFTTSLHSPQILFLYSSSQEAGFYVF